MSGTVLDACLCLVLVSAAAVTVASVPQPEIQPDRADATADSLATTASFEYTLAPGARHADPALATFDRTSGPSFTRHARGSLAALLARSATRSVRVNGERVTHAAADFKAKTIGATAAALPPRTQVVVRWRPYPGAHLGSEFSVGPRPPADADVNAATIRVPSGFSTPKNATGIARRSGFEGLAGAVARSLVTGFVPPARARIALAGDTPVSTLVRYRYRRLGVLYGASEPDRDHLDRKLDEDDARGANRVLDEAMRDEVETDLRTTFDSPIAAAQALDLETVQIAVRTWSS